MTRRGAMPADARATLSWRAQTLDEVLAACGSPDEGTSGPLGAVAGLMARWRAAYSGDDAEAFRRRLGWDGLDEARVATAVSSYLESSLPPDAPVSPWVDGLAEALSRGREDGPDLLRQGMPSRLATGWQDHPPPFVELWLPFLAVANRLVRERMRGPSPEIEATGLEALQRHLLLQLASTGELALFDRFGSAREGNGRDSGAESRTLYTAFLAEMFSGGLERLLTEYPALARRLWRFVSTWVATTAELLERLQRDLPAITRVICAEVAPGPVVDIAPGLSDRHEGGHQVAVLRFRSGAAVVYKPRDIGVEIAFQRLLAWLAAAGLRHVPVPLRMLARDGYGWSELAERVPLSSRVELRDYYRRAGSLVCLTHVLRGADLHMDNIVASPSGPALIDGEALLQPVGLGDLLAEAGDGGGWGGEGDLCTATGLLTFPLLDPFGEPYEIGGLSGSGGYVTDAARRVWRAVNTDAMQWTSVTARARGMENLPVVDGEERLPFPFADELTEGFAEAYRCLIRQRDALLAADGPLAGFAGVPTRVVLRPSALYVLVLSRLTTPRFQRRGIDAGVLIDSLNGVFRGASSTPTLWPLASAERSALEGLDVPRFTVRSDATDVDGPEGATVARCLQRSGLTAVTDRVRSLCEDDLARQLTALRRSLAAAGIRHAASRAAGPEVARGEGTDAASLWRACDEVLLEVATEAATGLVSRLAAGLEADGEGLGPFYLYDGLAGPALFLTALSRVSGEDAWGDSALRIWQELATRLPVGRTGARASEPIGACTGVGGLVYALSCAARMSGDAGLLGLATQFAALIGEAEIAADDRLDVEGGCAGAALGLLALFSCTGDRTVLARAVACADHLLARAVPSADGLAWPDAAGHHVTGFAHGASGIGYALARVSRAASRADLGPVVEAAFRFERSLFQAARGDWAVAATSSDSTPASVGMTAWCHGAPGIALARLGALGVTAEDSVRGDLEIALATTRRAKLSGLDHICCGNLGRIEILFTGGEVLERGELVRAAWAKLATVLTRATARGGFALERGPAGDRLGFFQGVCGAGYELLRLRAPEVLPSVLAFTAPPPSAAREVAK